MLSHMLDMVQHRQPFSIEAKKKKENAIQNIIKDRVICFNKTFFDAVAVIIDLISQNNKVMYVSF